MNANRRARLGAAAIVLLLLVSATSIVLAQESVLDGKLRTGETVVVPANETVDGDLYLVAGTVTMDGDVDGDLTVVGGQVTVNGSVTGDVLAAGGMISIAGTVEGDLRQAGGQTTLSGDVGEDVLAAGGQVTVASTGQIGGDLIAAGGDITVAGAVDGSIEASAGVYNRTGTVGGTERVLIGDRSVERETAAEPIGNAIAHFVALLVLGALAIWLVPRTVNGAEAKLRQRPLLSLGGGLAAIVGYFVFLIVAILLIILTSIVFGVLSLESLVGLAITSGVLAILVVSFLLAVAVGFGADIVVALAVARLTGRGGMGNRWRELTLFAIGAAVVVIVTSLPIVGGIAKLVVVLFGLGALAFAVYGTWQARRRAGRVAA